jgi:hypothetical protein
MSCNYIELFEGLGKYTTVYLYLICLYYADADWLEIVKQWGYLESSGSLTQYKSYTTAWGCTKVLCQYSQNKIENHKGGME